MLSKSDKKQDETAKNDSFSFWPSTLQMKNYLQPDVLSLAGNWPLPCCDAVTHRAPLSPKGNTLSPDVWISV